METRSAIVLVLLLLCPLRSGAQGVRLTRISGGVELGAESSLQNVKSSGQESRDFDRLRFDERIDLAAEGYVVTQQLLRFRLGGNAGLRQERLDVTGAAELGKIDERPFGYDALFDLFPSKLVSLLAFGNRSESTVVQNFGTDTESRAEVLGSTLNLRIPFLPSTFTWERQRTDSQTRGALVPSRRKETRRLLQYAGSHLSEAAQASLRLRQEDVDDASLPPVGDYRLRQADGSFGYRWGPYFEKVWRTTGRFFDRQGRFDFRNSSVSSSFLWDLTDTLRTRLQYDFDRFDTAGQRTLSNTAFFTLDHQLYESLHTSLGLSVDRSSQPSARRSTYGGDLSLAYRKRLPAASRLLVDVDLRQRIEESNVSPGPGLVNGEPVSIADVTGNFLVNRDVDATSVELFESLGGARLIEGVDYTVDIVGDRLSIDPLPGGSLAVGDVAFANYEFVLDPSATIATTGWGVGVGWQIGGFSVSFDHDQRDERRLSGSPTARLENARRDTVRLDLRGTRGAFRASSSGLFRADRSGILDFDEFSFRQTVTWQPLRVFDLTARGSETFRKFLDPGRNTDTLSASLDASWRPTPRWTVRAFANLRNLRDSESLDQRDLRAGARADLRFGHVELTPLLSWTQRRRGPSRTRDLRALLRFRRSF